MDESSPLSVSIDATSTGRSADAHAAPSSSERVVGWARKRPLAGVGVVALLGGLGLVARTRLATSTYAAGGAAGDGVELYDKGFVYQNVTQFCNQYDDDSVFDASLCEDNDAGMCGTIGTVTNTTCIGSYWCDELCGDECYAGEGAVCFYDKLTNLADTCTEVKAIMDDADAGTLAAIQADEGAKASIEEATANMAQRAQKERLEGYGPHDDVSDLGCGTHAWCEYCSGDCNSTAMSKFAKEHFDLLPHSNLNPTYAKYTLMNIISACEYFDYCMVDCDDDGK